jgi:hypothetical protein
VVIDAIFWVLHDTYMFGVLRGFLTIRVKNDVTNKEHESKRCKDAKDGGEHAGSKHSSTFQ